MGSGAKAQETLGLAPAHSVWSSSWGLWLQGPGAPRPGSWVLVCAARSWNLWWTGRVQGQPWAWGGLKAAFWWVGLCPHLVSCMA